MRSEVDSETEKHGEGQRLADGSVTDKSETDKCSETDKKIKKKEKISASVQMSRSWNKSAWPSRSMRELFNQSKASNTCECIFRAFFQGKIIQSYHGSYDVCFFRELGLCAGVSRFSSLPVTVLTKLTS